MIAEAIEKIQYLTTRGLMPTAEKIDGRTYVRAADGDILLVRSPLPAPLQVMTLTGIVDYVDYSQVENEKGDTFACLVESPSKVRLVNALDETLQRQCLLEATVPSDAMKGRLGHPPPPP